MNEGLSIEAPTAHRFPFLHRLLNRLLPHDCQLCGQPDAAHLLCRACLDDLPRLPAQRYPVCALPTPGAIANTTPCGTCLRHPPHFDATIAGFAYARPVDQLVQALKYSHQLALAGLFARLMLEDVAGSFPRGDVMFALPLSRQRLRERGFNQAVEIARPLARATMAPLDLQSALRTTDTVAQTSLPWKQRRANVRHAFECRTELTGKSVVVIDDVMTSGASLDEFARTLKLQGAAHITNWVFARTLKHEP